MTVFIGGLPRWADSWHVREWLNESGLTCLSCTILRGKACGFIECSSSESATAVIQRFDGAPIDGHILRASIARPRTTTKEKTPGASR
jgi:RNA recognition motif-containing protein